MVDDRGSLQVRNVYRLLQHRIAKPAATQLRCKVDLGRRFVEVLNIVAGCVEPPVERVLNLGVQLL